MNSDCVEARGLQFFEYSSGTFYDFLDELSLHPWRNSQVFQLPSVLNSVVMVLTVVLSPRDLKMSF